jgi:hypothetical protein
VPWYWVLWIVLASVTAYAGFGLVTEWLRYYVWGVRPKAISDLTFVAWPLAILWVGPFALLVHFRLYRRDVWVDFAQHTDRFGFKYVAQNKVIVATVEPAPHQARVSA